jgi:hypothetical protein
MLRAAGPAATEESEGTTTTHEKLNENLTPCVVTLSADVI